MPVIPGRYLLRRLLAAVPVVIGVTLTTFGVMQITAGSYVPGIELNPNLRPEDVERLRRDLGLDRPFHEQFLTWLWGVVRGDFGRSMTDGAPVIRHIFDRLPNTLELTATAIGLGAIFGVLLGVLSAVHRGKPLDRILTAVAVVGYAVPQFWLGLLMILLFSVSFHAWGLPWLPSGGATSPINGGDFVDRLAHLVMPGTVLAFLYLSIWSRFVRSSVLEALAQDYVRTARAKGLSERVVLFRHTMRNALIPLVTLVGLELPALIGGGLVVEVVFAWPGIGRLAFERALQYDFTTVMGTTTFAALLVVFGSLLADLLYGILDPRIRLT